MDYPHEVTGDPFLVEYQYSNDAFHRLKHVPGYVDNITYDGNGRVKQIDFTNGLSENTHRDELGRPIDAAVDMDPSATVDKFVQRYDYAWNARGNLAGRTWEEFNTKKGGVIDTVTETFDYDSNDRLTSMSEDSGFSMPYVYDPSGNRLNDPTADLSQVDTFYSCRATVLSKLRRTGAMTAK